MMNRIKHIIKYFYLSIKWHKRLHIDYSANIAMKASFEGMNKIYARSYFCGFMGMGSYIASDCQIEGKVGRFTSIASHCSIIQGVHPYTYPYVSTSPVFFSLLKQNGYTFAKEQIFAEHKYTEDQYPVVIGNDCWIGYGAKIIGGIKIGDGVIVLAGAVVTKDVPPYAIVGGVPAKVIRYRYDEDTVRFLLGIKWWNNSPEWFREHWDLLCDIEKLKAYYHGRLH